MTSFFDFITSSDSSRVWPLWELDKRQVLQTGISHFLQWSSHCFLGWFWHCRFLENVPRFWNGTTLWSNNRSVRWSPTQVLHKLTWHGTQCKGGWGELHRSHCMASWALIFSPWSMAKRRTVWRVLDWPRTLIALGFLSSCVVHVPRESTWVLAVLIKVS